MFKYYSSYLTLTHNGNQALKTDKSTESKPNIPNRLYLTPSYVIRVFQEIFISIM